MASLRARTSTATYGTDTPTRQTYFDPHTCCAATTAFHCTQPFNNNLGMWWAVRVG